MNKHLAELERKMFLEMYGEEELARVDALPPIKLLEHSVKKNLTIRDKIDKRNNEERITMKKFKKLFENLNVKGVSTNVEDQFKEIANQLMNEFVIEANGVEYQFGEIEFYYYEKGKHEDTFIHAVNDKDKVLDNIAAVKQSEMANWYFHYSGIDLTFGVKKNRYGGILIRSLLDGSTEKKDKQKLIGPLKLKNHLLNQYKSIGDDNYFLRLIYKGSNNEGKIIPMQRVGLGTAGNDLFREAKYRFVSNKIIDLVKDK